MIGQLLARRVASDAAMARLGQLLSFAAAGVIPVLVFHRITDVELSEGQLLIGALATMSLALNCTLMGLLLEPRTRKT